MKIREIFDGKKQRRRIKSDRRKIIYKRDGKRCRYCNKKVQYHTFHVDHILPVYHGGNDYVFNLCCSCPDCNLSKGANKWIKPKELPLWRKIYGILLLGWYLDLPTLEDIF